jgi:hypothetical protein
MPSDIIMDLLAKDLPVADLPRLAMRIMLLPAWAKETISEQTFRLWKIKQLASNAVADESTDAVGALKKILSLLP